jgi:hypothetical protein
MQGKWCVSSKEEDFGPTLAPEKLAERHGIVIAAETTRQWMLANRRMPRPVSTIPIKLSLTRPSRPFQRRLRNHQ